ncbi:hypothetical protein QL285_089735 [Trifolium repens]|nr:hypothetical protein QL285_089735 [Trifolium repens]
MMMMNKLLDHLPCLFNVLYNSTNFVSYSGITSTKGWIWIVCVQPQAYDCTQSATFVPSDFDQTVQMWLTASGHTANNQNPS